MLIYRTTNTATNRSGKL